MLFDVTTAVAENVSSGSMNWGTIVSLVVGLIGGGGLSPWLIKRFESFSSAEHLFKCGTRMMDKGKHKKATAYFDRALKKAPAFIGALEKQGESTFTAAQYRLAEFSFSKAIRALEEQTSAVKKTRELIVNYTKKAEEERKRRNDNTEWLLKERECYLFLQEHSTDVEDYGHLAECYAWRARCYARLAQPDKSKRDIKTALRIDRNCSVAYFSLGAIWDALKVYEKAIVCYNIAIELDPNAAFAYYNRGCAKDDLGEYVRAIEDYDEAIRLDHKDASAYYNRGCAKGALGRPEQDKKLLRQALKDYNKALRFNRKHVSAYHNREEIHSDLGHCIRAALDHAKAGRLTRKRTKSN